MNTTTLTRQAAKAALEANVLACIDRARADAKEFALAQSLKADCSRLATLGYRAGASWYRAAAACAMVSPDRGIEYCVSNAQNWVTRARTERSVANVLNTL